MSNIENDNVIESENSIKPKQPKRYSVVLLNCDYVAFPCVIHSLTESFNIDSDAAMQIASTAHIHGKATIATYSKDIAETKAEVAYQSLCKSHIELTGDEPTNIYSIIPFD